MRISIPSLPSPASKSLQGTLESAGYQVVSDFPSYTITLHEGDLPFISVDGPDSALTRLVTHRVGELARDGGVFVKVKDGNQNDKALAITLAPDAIEAVCVGVMRALDQIQVQHRHVAAVAEPLANASELLGNAVDKILDKQDHDFVRIMDRLKDVAFDMRESLKEHRSAQITDSAKVCEQIQRSTGQLMSHVITRADLSRRGLFDDLMTYYTRKRWWQVWK